MIRVGVIGTGMIGLDHIRRLHRMLSGCMVTAVSDLDADRAAVAAAETGARVFATGQELIADPTVDAVLVASSAPTHEDYLLPAIAAGKPVFCEKPLATTQEACLHIVNAEVEGGCRLIQVGFMRRFDPAYRALKRTIARGDIGTPLMFHSAHRNPSVPAGHYTSDMVLNDTLVHDVDIARWLLDDEVATVIVKTPRRNPRGGSLRDPVLVLLEMEGGALVDVEVSVNIAYGYDIRGEISGETGVVALADSNPVVLRNEGAFSGRVPADWRERFAAAYDAELREWLTAAASGGASGPSAWDGYAATAITDAALLAAKNGVPTPVNLRGRPQLYRTF